MRLSASSVSLALLVASSLRAMQVKAVSLTAPRSLRLARARVIRVITVVAGH